MERFLINMNLHVTGGTMLIVPMHHPSIGKNFFWIISTETHSEKCKNILQWFWFVNSSNIT